MTLLTHSLLMLQRHLRNLLRQPWWVVFSLVQPIIWLTLYGQLFKRVVELPGFNADSYISFVTPGVVIMSALFAGGWNGMGVIMDMNQGVMDRLLVSPIHRAAIILGRILSTSVTTVVQSLILIVLGFATGARFAGGIPGIIVLLVCAMLLAAPFAALSNALALSIRKQESVIGASNFILMPLTFLSPVFMAKDVMPDWIRSISRFNPVNWSVEAARAALSDHTDWNFVLLRIGCLLAFAVFSAALATRAFRAYQRSA
ncbi:MAG: ABC transporter permease [Acidobacteriota bacterium]|nr:ABC transporter permease [Acidobacteriota bacterium]